MSARKLSPPKSEDEGRKGQIRQVNEALILSAGERVFARAGFNGATVAEIADAAASTSFTARCSREPCTTGCCRWTA